MPYNTVIIDTNELTDSKSFIEEVTTISRKMIKEYRPDYLSLCASDRLSDENKKEMNALCDAMGISCHFSNDVSQSVKSFAENAKPSVIVATKDIGMCQFISDDLSVHDLSEDKFTDKPALKKNIGLKPIQIPLFLSICGYAEHSMKAIPFANPTQLIDALISTGESTLSSKLLDALPSLMSKKLSENAKLVNERVSLISFNKKEPSLTVPGRQMMSGEKLYAFYLKHKMYKWLPDDVREKNNIFLDGKIGARSVFVNSKESLQQLLDAVSKKGSVAMYFNDDIYKSLGYISLCVEQGDSYILNLSNNELRQEFASICENESIKVITNEAKSLYRLCAQINVDLKSLISDIQMGAHVMNSHYGKLTFSDKVKSITDIQPAEYHEYVSPGASKEKKTSNTIEYLADMADLTLRTNRKIFENLLQTKTSHILTGMELPLSKVLVDIEDTGVLLDKANLERFGLVIDKKLNDLEKEVTSLAGKSVNVNSPAEVAHLLYDVLGLGKNLSRKDTSEATLDKLGKEHPLPPKIIQCRSISRIRSSYITGLIKEINPETNRVHTTYQQDAASTGRLQGCEPNLQGIPSKSKDSREIKRSFIPGDDKKIIASDYSQVELKILAHLSGDINLINAFNSGRDIHRLIASEVLGIPELSITKEQRRKAKAINFGLIYGQTAYGLANELKIEKSEAQDYIDSYFRRYSGVAAYLNGVKSFAKNNGYVTTMDGRRIYTPNINSSNFKEAKAAERSAINAPVQGTAADIMKRAMILTHNEIMERNLEARIIMQIHDELVVETPDNEISIINELIKRNMESAANLVIPLTVDIDIGLNWEESHSLEDNKGIIPHVA